MSTTPSPRPFAAAARNRTLDLLFADLPTQNCGRGSVIEFTFFWPETQRWEGTNFSALVVERLQSLQRIPKGQSLTNRTQFNRKARWSWAWTRPH